MVGTPASNVIDYITIATTGNATDFGDMTDSKGSFGGCIASPTRALRMGGYPGSDVIDYVQIATTGNAADFGDALKTISLYISM